MIDKATFEALVRAEALKEFPGVAPKFDPLHQVGIRIEDITWGIIETKQSTYIAARMEHEWKLLAVIQQAYDAIDSLNDGGFGPLTSIEGVQAMSACIDALSPYATKPIEP